MKWHKIDPNDPKTYPRDANDVLVSKRMLSGLLLKNICWWDGQEWKPYLLYSPTHWAETEPPKE